MGVALLPRRARTRDLIPEQEDVEKIAWSAIEDTLNADDSLAPRKGHRDTYALVRAPKGSLYVR